MGLCKSRAGLQPALNSHEEDPSFMKVCSETLSLCLDKDSICKFYQGIYYIFQYLGYFIVKISLTCLMHENITHSQLEIMFNIPDCFSHCSCSDCSLYLPLRSMEVGFGCLLKVEDVSILNWIVTIVTRPSVSVWASTQGRRKYLHSQLNCD